MALTTAQKIALFEILEEPYTDSVDVPIDNYGLDAITVEASSGMQLQAKIIARLAALTSDEEARLLSYIAEWDTIGTSTVRIEGSVGGLQGVAYLPDERLRRIKSRVQVIIPVLKYKSELAIAAASGGAGGAMSVPLVR